MIDERLIQVEAQPTLAETVTFPGSLVAGSIHLVGDFNDRERSSLPLWRDGNGDWTRTVLMELVRVYQFRNLLDQRPWLTAPVADAHMQRPSGVSYSVIFTDYGFGPYLPQIAGIPAQVPHPEAK